MNSEKLALITIFNKLFDIYKNINLLDLSELTQEKKLKTLLIEIEPKIEVIGGKIEISDDTTFGIRYANMMSIMKCIEKYLNKSPEKDKFIFSTDIKNLLVINDLLKNDKTQLHILSEIILFLSSISSKKEYYLDKIGELEDYRLINNYLTHIEKYIQLDNKLDETNQSHLEKSFTVNNQLLKFREENEKFLRILKENEREISRLQKVSDNWEKMYQELELKLKDKERELEITKRNQNQNLKFNEESLKDNLIITQLNNQLSLKEMELADLKKSSESLSKKLNEEIQNLKEKNENLQEQIFEMKSLRNQNEKLTVKIKELNATKEKQKEFLDNKTLLEDKNKQIEILQKDKTLLLSQIEKLNKEILSEKEKFRTVETEKKRIETEFIELKKEFTKLEFKYETNHRINQNNFNSNNLSSRKSNSEIFADELKLDEIGDSILFDEFKDLRGPKINFTEKDFIELRNEKNELLKSYKIQIDEIQKLIDEKDKLLNVIENLKFQIEKNNSEKEKFEIEKEKLEIQIQKSQLDNRKLMMVMEKLESDKNKLENENKKISDKYENHEKEKESKVKEIEVIKNQLNTNKNFIEKILNEKQNLIGDYQSLQVEYEKVKQQLNQINVNLNLNENLKNKSKISPKNNQQQIDTLNLDVSSLKGEIQSLKLNLIQKEDQIKNLKEKLKSYESNETKTAEISKLTEDLEFYKTSYEEQKFRVNKEHELISSSLYDLALQFMSLKNELQRKINHNGNTNFNETNSNVKK